MRTHTRNRISRILLLVTVIGSSLISAGTPAFGSTACGKPDEAVEGSSPLAQVSADTATSPTSAASACLTGEVDATYAVDADGSGDPACGSACPLVQVSITAEGEIAAEAADSASGQDAPMTSTHASEQTQTCLMAGSRTGTACAEITPTESSGSGDTPPDDTPPDDTPPDDTPPEVRSVSLDASSDAAAPNDSVQFFGAIAGEDGCVSSQPVQLMAKRRGEAGFKMLRMGMSHGDGAFDFQVVVGTASEFRVLAPGHDECAEAVSRTLTLSSTR